MTQKAKEVLYFMLLAAVATKFLELPFENIDMTQQRLLVTYWDDYLFGVCAIFVGYALTFRNKK